MGIALFIGFFALLILGVPIAIAIAVPSFLVIWGADLGTAVIAPNFFSGIAKFPLLAIPLFILAGFILERCGISQRIIRFANILVGRRRGGLAIVAIGVCVFFGGVSGSGPADSAAIGAILIPAMFAQGYSKGYSAALIAAAGSTAIIVPPSIALIVYGAITNTSVPALFAAGAIPGFLAGMSLLIPAIWIARKRGYGSEQEGEDEISLKDSFIEAFWGLLAPVIILGGLYGGIFTPTEAAVVAVFYSLFLGVVIYRTLSFKRIYEILVDASEASAIVMLIVAFAGLFSWAGSTVGILDSLAGLVMGISSNEWVVLFIINLLIFVGGMLIDAISIFYIFLPIFLPIMAHYGWDPVWFGVMMTLNLAIGQFTPPVAVNLYVTTQLADIRLEETFKAVWPMVIAMLVALVVVVIFPSLSLFIPQFFGLM
ncbi:TRAP transporter large permease [Desulforhopalus sp. IMCC35007]|uniref:TRAP transporter large permease n=1 Tax=Desulforhopalus sp. IMCC35007 TaxID=2569543 RepID=UPI0010AE3115|nr:TRAP transporter large permease [Desulforhopalus sp. IMCC35007]TKB07603.1 TRAP transporter large permease [Desulforhopalus sp. IMCC35007]